MPVLIYVQRTCTHSSVLCCLFRDVSVAPQRNALLDKQLPDCDVWGRHKSVIITPASSNTDSASYSREYKYKSDNKHQKIQVGNTDRKT